MNDAIGITRIEPKSIMLGEIISQTERQILYDFTYVESEKIKSKKLRNIGNTLVMATDKSQGGRSD